MYQNKFGLGMSKYILSVLFFLCSTVSHGQVYVSMKMDTNHIYIGEQVLLKLKVTANSNQVVVMPEFPDSQLVKGVEVLNHYTEKEERLDGGKRLSLTEAYRITSFDSALYYIPPIEVQVDGKVLKSSQGLALKVVSPSVDTTKVEKINGPMENVEVSYDWNDLKKPFLSWIIGVVMLILALYMALQIKNNHRIVPKIIFMPERPPHRVALRRLNNLKKKEGSDAEYLHLFFTELADILKIYIEKRYDFKATAMTTSQMMEQLKDNTPQSLFEKLKELFQTADLIKYAGISGSGEKKDTNLLLAAEYIDATKEETGKKVRKQASEPEVRRSYKMRIILIALNYIVAIFGCGLVAWLIYTIYNMMF